MTLMLGKQPARDDKRTLKLENYLDLSALPPPPLECDWTAKVGPSWGMMGNDRIGDCAIVAPGHMMMAWTGNAGTLFRPTDAQIVTAYSAVSGYDPRTGQNDNGCVLLDVLNYWRKTGIAGHKIGAYVKLRLKDHAQAMLANWLFGGLLVGVMLPLTAQGQDVWDVPPSGAVGRGAPGSWGGHAVNKEKHDAGGPVAITWGAPKRMTWRFWDTYVDEIFCCISQDWLDSTGRAPNSLDMAALTADLAAITGEPIPPPAPPIPPVPPPVPPTPPVPPVPVGVTLAQVLGWLDAETKLLQQKNPSMSTLLGQVGRAYDAAVTGQWPKGVEDLRVLEN